MNNLITTILAGKPERTDHLGDLGIDGRITQKWISGIWGWRMVFGFTRLRIRPSSGLL
jgi:hypothetical protein